MKISLTELKKAGGEISLCDGRVKLTLNPTEYSHRQKLYKLTVSGATISSNDLFQIDSSLVIERAYGDSQWLRILSFNLSKLNPVLTFLVKEIE
jgi:hypothetical protein